EMPVDIKQGRLVGDRYHVAIPNLLEQGLWHSRSTFVSILTHREKPGRRGRANCMFFDSTQSGRASLPASEIAALMSRYKIARREPRPPVLASPSRDCRKRAGGRASLPLVRGREVQPGHLVGVVTGSHERAAGDLGESELSGEPAQLIELGRGEIA